ncbi:hypothetical protein PHSY_000249 [Pseudozyma hubeiensis SY62]|uniref:Uncharacterized protein n=1 Tax=Pseudozyma hubeiensis (strain SY62) TaxID=1305764 RepID=R9NW23_PSEHS|nr:hypothetical protein PHSY_000249 [Pseudozyma hubeiensis SY62]GAC92694.1 hypothetical protein PHSY_000249 [Pseudozyma hubeiensis SY62]
MNLPLSQYQIPTPIAKAFAEFSYGEEEMCARDAGLGLFFGTLKTVVGRKLRKGSDRSSQPALVSERHHPHFSV